MARWRKDFSPLWTGKATLCNDLIEWLPNNIAFQCAIARCMPKSTFIESNHDFHQWHQWVECRTILTPLVIMRSREVLWGYAGAAPLSLWASLDARNSTSIDKDCSKSRFIIRCSMILQWKLQWKIHWKAYYTPFRTFSRCFHLSLKKDRGPRPSSERYGKIVISLPFTLSRNPYFVLRETKVHNTNSLCLNFFYFSVHLIWFTYLQNQYLHLNKMSPEGTNNGVKLLMYRTINCNRFNFLQFL